ncbi:hypothetical protein M0813_25822 [Anaeramoeba flamelloides]|uniref:Transmembrane protein n=1 Tax=Anaeramoeba flamelloides TaxID=1746091 RepID=A0ABQ8Y170_9EUKA|nr:hypothetical protein M0813_25822 [Anaeramoeba flamelloides]
MTKSRVSKYLPLMSVLLFVSLIFITAALIWLLHFHLPLKNSLVKHQRFDPRKPTCLEYTHPDLDFYNKFSKNKSHECWIFKDKPEMSTLDYPVTNYAWSAFFWIPALVFLGFDLFGLCTALVDWKRIKKIRRIQLARNNIEMVPSKSGSESRNKEKKKDLTIEGRREKKQEKLEQDFFAIDAEKKKDLSLEENQQNL